jgi:hypothetical protein
MKVTRRFCLRITVAYPACYLTGSRKRRVRPGSAFAARLLRLASAGGLAAGAAAAT